MWLLIQAGIKVNPCYWKRPLDCTKHIEMYIVRDTCRADSRFAPSQWETTLLCNDASHWLGANLESALTCVPAFTWLTEMMRWYVLGHCTVILQTMFERIFLDKKKCTMVSQATGCILHKRYTLLVHIINYDTHSLIFYGLFTSWDPAILVPVYKEWKQSTSIYKIHKITFNMQYKQYALGFVLL